jgi:hypothetical protein
MTVDVHREAIKEAVVELKDNVSFWTVVIGTILFLGSVWWIWGLKYMALIAGALLMWAGFMSL